MQPAGSEPHPMTAAAMRTDLMIQTDTNKIEGVRLALRLAQPSDASYIYGLRIDPTYNRYLSEVTGTVQDQEDWLRRYKEREARGSEYYFVIERLADAQPCGLVRLYDIEGDQCTWGSWILDHNKTPKAALESAVLSYVFAFEHLNLSKALIDVRLNNDRSLRFQYRLGAVEIRRDDRDIFFEYSRTRFLADKEMHWTAIRAES